MSDRLAGLLGHYSLSARVFHTGLFCGREGFRAAAGVGYVHLLRRGPLTVRSPLHAPLRIDAPSLLFYPRPADHDFVAPRAAGVDLVCAEIDFGAGCGNPLAGALPDVLLIALDELPSLGTTLELLFAEAFGDHCGRQAAIDRLCEVLLIQLLRHAMDQHLTRGGLIAGLADRRLAKAITAMHDDPRRDWTLEDLAALAGMSRARFAVNFRRVVGSTPGQYLAGWRIGLAQALLRKGKPVALVADAVGYASTTALARAFRAQLGCSPGQWRTRQP